MGEFKIDPVVGPVVTGAGAVGPGTAVASDADVGGDDGRPAAAVLLTPWAQPATASAARANVTAGTPTRRDRYGNAK